MDFIFKFLSVLRAVLDVPDFFVTGHPCSLFCKPKNPRYRFSAKLASKVIDGTPCRPGSVDICVNGRCQVKNITLYIWKNARFFKWPSLMLFITHFHTYTHVARFSVKSISRDRNWIQNGATSDLHQIWSTRSWRLMVFIPQLEESMIE